MENITEESNRISKYCISQKAKAKLTNTQTKRRCGSRRQFSWMGRAEQHHQNKIPLEQSSSEFDPKRLEILKTPQTFSLVFD